MGIYSLEGPMGSGKTTVAVTCAYGEFLGEGVLDSIYWGRPPSELGSLLAPRKVISNVHLNFEHTKFDIAWFLQHLTDDSMEECIIVLDELYQIADNRTTQSKLNRVFTYFVPQSRKRGIDILLCTHYIEHIDVKIRRFVDVRGTCRTSLEKPCRKCKGVGEVKGMVCDRCLGYGQRGVTSAYFLNKRTRRRSTLELDPANEYWHLFDTKEKVPMMASQLSGIDTMEMV